MDELFEKKTQTDARRLLALHLAADSMFHHAGNNQTRHEDSDNSEVNEKVAQKWADICEKLFESLDNKIPTEIATIFEKLETFYVLIYYA